MLRGSVRGATGMKVRALNLWLLAGIASVLGVATPARAYETDPEFYAFYRSLEAYRRAFEAKDGVLVLDPTSDFFQYFENGAKR